VREAPSPPGNLAERLGHPAREGQIVKLAEAQAVFFPEEIERSISVSGHRSDSVDLLEGVVEQGSHALLDALALRKWL
jgi:hypothetical protein